MGPRWRDIDLDNDGAFLSAPLEPWFEKHHPRIELTSTLAYQSNDQACPICIIFVQLLNAAGQPLWMLFFEREWPLPPSWPHMCACDAGA